MKEVIAKPAVSRFAYRRGESLSKITQGAFCTAYASPLRRWAERMSGTIITHGRAKTSNGSFGRLTRDSEFEAPVKI